MCGLKNHGRYRGLKHSSMPQRSEESADTKRNNTNSLPIHTRVAAMVDRVGTILSLSIEQRHSKPEHPRLWVHTQVKVAFVHILTKALLGRRGSGSLDSKLPPTRKKRRDIEKEGDAFAAYVPPPKPLISAKELHVPAVRDVSEVSHCSLTVLIPGADTDPRRKDRR